MRYIDCANAELKRNLGDAVLFGQNLAYGSCLSGLTPGIPSVSVPNCENALIGMGFGLMLSGVNSVYAMKHLDFLMLSIDQLRHTWRGMPQQPTAGFTILAAITDTGSEGIQSGFENLRALEGVTGIYGEVCNSHAAIVKAFAKINSPGPRIICLRQSLWQVEG